MTKQQMKTLREDLTFALNNARTADRMHRELHPNENSYLWQRHADVIQSLEMTLDDLKEVSVTN